MACCTVKISSYKEHAILLVLVAMQFFFWNGLSFSASDSDPNNDTVIWQGTRSEKPAMDIIPPLPHKYVRKILALGDDQFYFRKVGLDIQNAGDTFGRTTSLRKYDYSKLYQWWMALDDIDSVSDFIPSLASYYYGATSKTKEQTPYVVDYLEQHADKDPSTKWWWYNQALYHAKSKMKDLDRALIIANKMHNIPKDVDVPMWVRQMKAFVYEDKGEFNQACDIIINILEGYEDLEEGELNFIYHFITQRLSAMADHDKQEEIDPRCKAIIDRQAI